MHTIRAVVPDEWYPLVPNDPAQLPPELVRRWDALLTEYVALQEIFDMYAGELAHYHNCSCDRAAIGWPESQPFCSACFAPLVSRSLPDPRPGDRGMGQNEQGI